MNVPDDVLRGIGGIAVNAVWVEAVAASFYARGLDDAIAITTKPGAALRRGQEAVDRIEDEQLKANALAWLNRARELLDTARHPFVHGLAHYD